MAIDSTNRTALEKTKWRQPAWLIGAICGDIFWGLAFVGTFVMGELNVLYPYSNAAEILQFVVGIIATPFFVIGLELWGDEIPWWIAALFADIPFCLCLYALLGALVGRSIARNQSWRFILRTLLIVIAVVAVLLGIAVALND